MTADSGRRAVGGACAATRSTLSPTASRPPRAAGVAVVIQPGGGMHDDENIARPTNSVSPWSSPASATSCMTLLTEGSPPATPARRPPTGQLDLQGYLCQKRVFVWPHGSPAPTIGCGCLLFRGSRRGSVFAALAPMDRGADRRRPPPRAGTILVGDDSASAGYIRMKQETAESVGFTAPTSTSARTPRRPILLAAIHAFNEDPSSGQEIIVQHPAPKQIDYEAALLEIDPDKDVDGAHPLNMGRLALGMPGPVPCTPAGIEALLAHYNIPVAGPGVCVLGRGFTLGSSAGAAAVAEASDGGTPRSRSSTRASPTGRGTPSGPPSWWPRQACPASCSPSTSPPVPW